MNKIRKLDLFSNDEFSNNIQEDTNIQFLSDREVSLLKKASNGNLSYTRIDTINRAMVRKINPLLITSSIYSDVQANAIIDVLSERKDCMQCINNKLTVEEILNYKNYINPNPQRIEESFIGYEEYKDLGLVHGFILDEDLDALDTRLWCLESGMPITVLSSLLEDIELLWGKTLFDLGKDVNEFFDTNLDKTDRLFYYYLSYNDKAVNIKTLKEDVITLLNNTYNVNLDNVNTDLLVSIVNIIVTSFEKSANETEQLIFEAIESNSKIGSSYNIFKEIKNKIYKELKS